MARVTINRVELTFPDELFQRMEAARGELSRAAFIKGAVEAALPGQKAPTSQDVKAHLANAREAMGLTRACPNCGGLNGTHQRGCAKGKR